MTSEQIKRASMREMLKNSVKEGIDRFRTLNVKDAPSLAQTRGKVMVSTRKHDDGKTFSLGIAFCNPNDQFDRLKGRMISHGRMEKNPITFERVDGEMVKTTVKKIVVIAAGVDGVLWMEGITPEDLV